MERVRLHPPAPPLPLPPLLRPMRLAVPDYQGLDFPVESDCSPVSSDAESEYYVSNEYDNCTDNEGEGSGGPLFILRGSDYDSDLECNELFWVTYFQQVDESERIDVKKHYKKYPGRRLLPSYPLHHYLRDRKKRRMLRGYAEGALKKYNDDKGTDYVFESVRKVKGYGCRDRMYYLIFLAKMGNGHRQFIQAMVVKDQKDNVDFPVVMPRVDD